MINLVYFVLNKAIKEAIVRIGGGGDDMVRSNQLNIRNSGEL